MYSKSTEVQGFKSFANKLVFEFHNGITGIVNPNGSDKSNVADAVRWVLGEQRIKRLRGISMQDVIFAETEMRKPQEFAYVTIILDSNDHRLAIGYGQVTISRRLYRSGEGEYMISGSICRLKDINKLFYDTGTGKEGYSIIGQEQIDRILNGKPEERRELFDEVAGIVKFKRRKAITQEKLEDGQANLVRVSGILSELEEQMGPLERQFRTVRGYLQLKDSLKVCDANLFLMETKGAGRQLEEMEKHQQILSGDMEDTGRESEHLKTGYEELKQSLTDLERRIAADRDEPNQDTVLKRNLEGRINVLKEQIHMEEMNQEHLEHRRNVIKEELAAKNQQLDSYKGELETMSSQVRDALKHQEKAGARLEGRDEAIRRLEEAIEGAKGNIIQAFNERAPLTARQQRYETMLEQANLRRSEVSQELLRLKSDESMQNRHIGRERASLGQLNERLGQKQFTAQEAEGALLKAEQESRRLNRNLNDTQQKYHMAYTKLESLKSLAEHYDGYDNSIRRVMEVHDRIHGIHGVVANIVTTSQKYETAIEAALDESVQNTVTGSETAVKQLIKYLKKNKYGRATFLPLTSINDKQVFSQLAALKEKGVLGLAGDLVQVDSRYEGLARYLLGRVVMADTTSNIIALARKYKYSLRIVALEGEPLSTGGSMTGGAFRNSNNLLGRRREIDELENTCSKALVQVKKTQKELNLEESLTRRKKGELEKQRADIQSMTIRENTICMNVSQLEDKKVEIAESSTDLVREHGQLGEQVKEINESRSALTQDSRKLERVSTQANQGIEDKTVLLEDSRKKQETCAADLSALQMGAANLCQKQDFIRENSDHVSGEIEKLTEGFDSLTEGTENSGQVIEGKRREIAHLGELVRDVMVHMKELEQVMAGHEAEKEKMSLRQKASLAEREELTARLAELDKDMFHVQAQEEKLEEKLEASTAYMWSEYKMAYSTALGLKRKGRQSVPEVKKLIDESKSRIGGLGNINVNAIEDYKEVSKCYEFMRAQHEDLVTTQAELEKVIKELDTGMRRQFEEKFGEIRAEFDEVFKGLFEGGRGTPELMEGEDILEAGIQITAQPPSKKLQNMTQLSGGEKALTAISLLPAIQSLKPSPFCLPDEIETALDNSNVSRFVGCLHKLTRNTQFIVITRRRDTMVSTDRLYGIAMQKKGVSTLISMNLIVDDLDE